MRAHVDFETGCALDLTKVGLFKQIEHPSFRVWCMAWRILDDHAHTVTRGIWHPGDPDPQPLLDHCANGGTMAVHNNAFDRSVWNRYVRRKLCKHWPQWAIEQSDCTMARCAIIGVPESLDIVAIVLGLKERKDADGAKNMREMMKPKRILSCWNCAGEGYEIDGYSSLSCDVCSGTGSLYEWNDGPEFMAKQDRYCDQDVAVEIEVDNKAPSMPAFERPIWQLDQEINETGVMIDKPLVERANTLVDYAKVQLNRRLYELTGGAVERASMVRKLAKWVNARGVECTTIGKGDQEDLIFRAGVIADDDIIQAIEIRRSASKTSTSKLERMLDCVCADGAIYFQLHYFGAHTGRWAGRLVQLQNLYRTDEERDGKDIDITLDLLQRIPDTRELHDALMAVLGDVMTPIAKCMRRFIIARPGNRLIGGDLSNIEGCVNAWLADETWKIDAYRAYQEGRGPDLYVVTYAKSFGVDVSEVTKPQRQLGKVEELALGYQGSVGAFYTFTQTYLMKLDDILPVVRASATPDEWDRAMFLFGLAGKRFQYELTREMWAALRIIVDNYRKANPKIVQSWWDRQDAAITAVGNPGNVVECLDGKIRYLSDRGFLWCMLPSGSVRAYCDPMLVTKDDSFVMFGDGTRHGRDEYEAEDWNKLIVNPDVDYYKRIRNQVQYKGYHGTKRVWGFKNLYGGLQCENDVSGTSRDILVAGMFRAKAAGYKTVLTVHDEILCEMPIGRGSKEELRQIMTAREYWYAGLPLAASTWEGSRYEK